jgi:hypothetical protein
MVAMPGLPDLLSIVGEVVMGRANAVPERYDEYLRRAVRAPTGVVSGRTEVRAKAA